VGGLAVAALVLNVRFWRLTRHVEPLPAATP
jgi:hypothetical protein